MSSVRRGNAAGGRTDTPSIKPECVIIQLIAKVFGIHIFQLGLVHELLPVNWKNMKVSQGLLCVELVGNLLVEIHPQMVTRVRSSVTDFIASQHNNI